MYSRLVFAFLCLPMLLIAQIEQAVQFSSPQAELAGTLSLPDTLNNHPAIVLISGSGPQNRDSEIMGMKPFKLLSDHLVEQGYAVLRFDDRGVGESKGPSVAESTMSDLALDTKAAVALLRVNPNIDTNHIGLLGHSEGGAIAPMIAAEDPKVGFVILLAGYGVVGRELSLAQQEIILKSSGMPEYYIDAAKEVNGKLFDMAAQPDLSTDSMQLQAKALLLSLVEDLPSSMKASVPDPEAFAEQQAAAVTAQLKAPWTASYIAYDPAPTLSKVSCPVLMIFGELDTQVSPEQNQQVMETALREGGNANVQSVIIPQANHLFQKANTGSITEYSTLAKEFAPEFLTVLTAWLLDTAPPANK